MQVLLSLAEYLAKWDPRSPEVTEEAIELWHAAPGNRRTVTPRMRVSP